MGFGRLQAQSIDVIVYSSPLTLCQEKRGRVQQMAILDARQSVARGSPRARGYSGFQRSFLLPNGSLTELALDGYVEKTYRTQRYQVCPNPMFFSQV
jgi:hypothetical protein